MGATGSEDSLRVLLAFYEENARQARYHGMQRQAVTATVLLGAALVLVLAGEAGTIISSRLSGILLCGAGVYGFLASLHHHERGRLHVERLHAVREALWREFPGGVGDLYGAANAKHLSRFPVFSEKTARIHYSWQLVSVVVFFLGLFLSFRELL
jgi:hypothetical protein